jgi:glycerophosphoryl diester phosphodiesterase
MSRPLVIGHRGASGHALENSLAAFRLAAAPEGPDQCDGVELDVHTTADGRFVVHHDALLPSGEPIGTMPSSRVRATKLADGSTIPTLEEALDVLNRVQLFVEVKGLPAASDAALLAVLSRHPAGRLHLHAFDHRIVARLGAAVPDLSLGVLSASYPLHPVREVLEAGARTLWQGADLIDRDLVEGCHDAGVAIVAWTVNDRAEAVRLAALGVDGLCGNWPERLRVARW